MNTAEPLTITSNTIARIMRLATLAHSSPDCERNLYVALQSLPAVEQADLMALYMLGRAGVRSFNVALANAQRQNASHIAGMLAEKTNLTTCLNAGLKRYHRQS